MFGRLRSSPSTSDEAGSSGSLSYHHFAAATANRHRRCCRPMRSCHRRRRLPSLRSPTPSPPTPSIDCRSPRCPSIAPLVMMSTANKKRRRRRRWRRWRWINWKDRGRRRETTATRHSNKRRRSPAGIQSQNFPADKCVRWRRARRSIRFVLSLLGGGVEDHDVGGTICSA